MSEEAKAVQEIAKAAQEISKPADTLIDRVSSAIGIFYEPTHIRRVARAEADAKAIVAQGDIDAFDLRQRALHRLASEEAKKQENIESVFDRAIPLITIDAKPEELDEDWIANFFDKVKTVSNEEAQNLWAQLLAVETNNPNSVSKRTINILHSLDKKDAELFQKLTRYMWRIGDFIPLIFDVNDQIYNQNDINFGNLQHLESLGLIHLNMPANFARVGFTGTVEALYGKSVLELEFGSDKNSNIITGKVSFTNVGEELALMTRVPVVDGFYEYVAEKWAKHVKSK